MPSRPLKRAKSICACLFLVAIDPECHRRHNSDFGFAIMRTPIPHKALYRSKHFRQRPSELRGDLYSSSGRQHGIDLWIIHIIYLR